MQQQPETVDAKASAVIVGTAEALPVTSLREAIPYLRRPFTPEATRFKVQAVFGGATGCLVVAYIDQRLVTERLNRVIPDRWSAAYELIPGSKLMWCALTVDGVTRTDIGESSKGLSKDLVSDALKRAAVPFGVGVSIYALPQIVLRAGQKHVEKRTKPKETLVLTEYGHEKLREGYAKWLAEHGVARFGPPLDHGDVEGATLDADDEAPEFAPEPAAALEDEKAATLTAAIKAAYKQLTALDGGSQAVPPGRFNAWLRGAAHSHEELARLLDHIEMQRDLRRIGEAKA